MVRRTARLVVFVWVFAACSGDGDAVSTATPPPNGAPPQTPTSPPGTANTTTTTNTSARYAELDLAIGRDTLMTVAGVSAADLMANTTAEAVAGDVSPQRREELAESAFAAASVVDTNMFLSDPEPAAFGDAHTAAASVSADLLTLANAWITKSIDDDAAGDLSPDSP